MEPFSKLLKFNSSLPRQARKSVDCQKTCQKNCGFDTIPPELRHDSAEGDCNKKLAAAVAAAYGFPADLTDEQILESLLALNLERAGEGVKAAKATKSKTSREKRADELV